MQFDKVLPVSSVTWKWPFALNGQRAGTGAKCILPKKHRGPLKLRKRYTLEDADPVQIRARAKRRNRVVQTRLTCLFQQPQEKPVYTGHPVTCLSKSILLFSHTWSHQPVLYGFKRWTLYFPGKVDIHRRVIFTFVRV